MMLANVMRLVVAISLFGFQSGEFEAQESERPGFASGFLSDHAEQLRKILVLKVDAAGRLSMDRNTWRISAAELEERKAAAIKSAAENGVAPRRGRRRPVRRGTSVPVAALVGQFVDEVAGERGGQSGSSNGKRIRQSWSNQEMSATVSADVRSPDGNFMLQLIENQGSGRILQVHENGMGDLKIIVTGSESVWVVHQRSSGSFVVSGVLGTEIFHGVASDFAEFNRDYPENAEQLARLMQHVGFALPLKPDSPSVVAAVKMQIAAIYGESEEAFGQLIESLDADEFETREAAKIDLTDRYPQLRMLAKRQVATGKGSLESRAALTAMEENFLARNRSDRLSRFIDNSNLVNSIPYVVGLLQTAKPDEQAVLIEHLQAITGAKLGGDMQAWSELADQIQSPKQDKSRDDK